MLMVTSRRHAVASVPIRQDAPFGRNLSAFFSRPNAKSVIDTQGHHDPNWDPPSPREQVSIIVADLNLAPRSPRWRGVRPDSAAVRIAAGRRNNGK